MIKSLAAVAAATVTAVGVAACGASEPAPQAPAKPAATPAPATVQVLAPSAGDTIRTGVVTVRGIVTPTDAEVTVLGDHAEVDDGRFERQVVLGMGDNTIDVVATREGAAPASATVVVTRGLSEAKLAAARKRRAAHAAAARKRRAAARAAAAEAANAPVAVPDLVGERLDVARLDLRGRGLRATVIGGGFLGVLVEANWTVCETRPAAGASVPKRTRVKLIVDRAC
jgi:hypothetical protein